MDSNKQKSILEMARGGFMERVDYEMPKILANILDANTKATAKRKISITLEFAPDDARENVTVSFSVKSTPAPSNPMRTTLYIAGSQSTGEVNVVEMVPQMPGQTSLDGVEQEAPPMLRLINF